MSGVVGNDGGMAVRFLHTSDFQIGMTRAFLDSDAAPRFEQDRLEAVTRLGEVAKQQECDFIVVAGDVFEHNALSRRTLARALEVLRRIEVPVYLLPGNHDPLTPDSVLHTLDGSDGLHAICDNSPFEVATASGERCEIVGAPLRSKHAAEDLLQEALSGLEPVEHVRIAVAHAQDFGDFGEDPIDVEETARLCAAGVVDYVALGDTHSTTQLEASGRIWYSGAPETTAFREAETGGGEKDSGNVLVVSIDKEGGRASVEVEKHRVGAWTFDSLHAEVHSEEDVAAFVDKLDAYPDKPRTVVKYTLVGTLSLHAMRELEQGIDALRPSFAALYERTRKMNLLLEPGEDELADLGMSGYAARTLEELMETARLADASREELPADVIAARDAINLLFRLSKED